MQRLQKQRRILATVALTAILGDKLTRSLIVLDGDGDRFHVIGGYDDVIDASRVLAYDAERYYGVRCEAEVATHCTTHQGNFGECLRATISARRLDS